MDKETYKALRANQTELISNAHAEIKRLTLEYIDWNKTFVIGDRVRVITPEFKKWNGTVVPESFRFAYVNGIDLDWQDNIRYMLKKEKKDGTKSLINDSVSGNETLSLENIV